MSGETRQRSKFIAGVGVVVVAGSIAVLATASDPPELDLECVEYVEEEGTIECVEVAAPTTTTAPSTTSTTAPTTTTTTGEEQFPADTISSEFSVAAGTTWRSTGWGMPSDSSSEPTGNFRIFCEFSHLGYYDPILAPGVSNFMHLHMFWGNEETDETSTYASLRSGGGSTCSGGPINRTAYWMPALIDPSPVGGSGPEVMIPSLFIAYYKAEQSTGANLAERQASIAGTGGYDGVQEYPNGFRYLGGRNPTTNTLYVGGINWKCEGGSNSGSTIPNSCPSGEALIASVRFPHCWDGVNGWLPDNAHVAGGGPSNNSTWAYCQEPFPVYLPSLTEFAYFPSASDMSDWYLSSDRMSSNPANWYADGASFHADWFGAWDPIIQTLWTEECVRGMRNANAHLCDGSGLVGAPNYTGPSRVTGWTPMHPDHGDNGWPTGQEP